MYFFDGKIREDGVLKKVRKREKGLTKRTDWKSVKKSEQYQPQSDICRYVLDQWGMTVPEAEMECQFPPVLPIISPRSCSELAVVSGDGILGYLGVKQFNSLPWILRLMD